MGEVRADPQLRVQVSQRGFFHPGSDLGALLRGTGDASTGDASTSTGDIDTGSSTADIGDTGTSTVATGTSTTSPPTTGDDPDTTGDPPDVTTTTATDPPAQDGGGCGCAASSVPQDMSFGLLALLALRRRRSPQRGGSPRA